MSKTFNIQYLVLPDFVFRNENLTYMSAKVYSFIHNYRMPEFFYGNEKLAELFDCSEVTISRAISQLEKEGFITTRFNGRLRFIEDNFVTHRVIKNDEADLSPLIIPSQATESSTLIKQNQASTAELIRKDNKKSLGKNFSEIEVDESAYADKGWLEAKRTRKQNKGRGQFQGRNFPPASSNYPYKEKEKKGGYAPKTVVDAEDVIWANTHNQKSFMNG